MECSKHICYQSRRAKYERTSLLFILSVSRIPFTDVRLKWSNEISLNASLVLKIDTFYLPLLSMILWWGLLWKTIQIHSSPDDWLVKEKCNMLYSFDHKLYRRHFSSQPFQGENDLFYFFTFSFIGCRLNDSKSFFDYLNLRFGKMGEAKFLSLWHTDGMCISFTPNIN